MVILFLIYARRFGHAPTKGTMTADSSTPAIRHAIATCSPSPAPRTWG